MLLLRLRLLLGRLLLMLLQLLLPLVLFGRGNDGEWRDRLAQSLRALGTELSAAQCQMVAKETRRKNGGGLEDYFFHIQKNMVKYSLILQSQVGFHLIVGERETAQHRRGVGGDRLANGVRTGRANAVIVERQLRVR
jgi:hypothetical protein